MSCGMRTVLTPSSSVMHLFPRASRTAHALGFFPTSPVAISHFALVVTPILLTPNTAKPQVFFFPLALGMLSSRLYASGSQAYTPSPSISLKSSVWAPQTPHLHNWVLIFPYRSLPPTASSGTVGPVLNCSSQKLWNHSFPKLFLFPLTLHIQPVREFWWLSL